MTRSLRRLFGFAIIVAFALFAAKTSRPAETSAAGSPGWADTRSEVAPLDAGAPPEGLSEDAWGKILRQVRASQNDTGSHGVDSACDSSQIAKPFAADAAAGDWFGWSVSVSGDTAVVGALFDHNAGRLGSAYVFGRNVGGADTWGQVTKLTAADATGSDFFGWSVSVSGDTVVVGARNDDDAGVNSGSTYVFERNELSGGGAEGWGQVAKLTASDAAAGDQFGTSVSVSGDTLVVGAHRTDPLVADSGSVYVFERINVGGDDAWDEVAILTASDAAAYDEFGKSVSVDGDTVVVGAHNDDDAGSESGSAYVFKRDEGGVDAWGQVAKLTASDAVAGDEFGTSVSVSGDTVVIGALRDDAPRLDSGSAYVFERRELDGGRSAAWLQVDKLTASDTAANGFFGASVSVRGDTVVVGAYGAAAAGYSSGSAYVFERRELDGGGAVVWDQVAQLAATDGALGDQFGVSVSVDGDTFIVGSYLDDDAGSESGSAYILALGCATCGDAVREAPEGCDDGPANSDNLPDACRTDCTLAGCGDDVTDSGEACDDGASNSDTAPDACRTDCTFAACGDGVTDTGEECDDANTDDGDGCSAECRNECGDGIQEFAEECDDGTANSDTVPDACRTDCTLSGCGDAVMDSGEECDEGADNSDTAPDACRTDCSFAACGDRIIDTGEECDDGNTDGGDGCSATCQNECGDGIQGTLEECDNGAANSDSIPDACRTDCTLPGCGDVVVDSGEECDDGGANSDTLPDACRVDCTLPRCGDAVMDSGEECDEGADNSDTAPDACRTDCSITVCGDGIIDTGEDCDDGNTDGGDGCDATCQNECSDDDQEWNEIAKPDGFGGSVSISGDRVMVRDRIFERNEGGVDAWGLVAELDVSFTNVDSASISGDVAVWGGDGRAFVFERRELSGGGVNWTQVAELERLDAGPGDQFGFAVAVSGETIVVGAYWDDDGGTYTGSAYVFERGGPAGGTPGPWRQVAKLRPPDVRSYDFFGYSVAIGGDRIVVGRNPYFTAQATGTGSVYVFERNAGGPDGWGQVAKLIASDAAENDRFGASVSVNGDTIVVGRLIPNAAYVFERRESKGGAGADDWVEVAKISDPVTPSGDGFGSGFADSVAVSGDRVLVGAYNDEEVGSTLPDTGSVYVYERDEGGADAWGQVIKLTASDPDWRSRFGSFVALEGDTVVVGDGAGSSSSAYILRRGCVTCGDAIPEAPEECDDGTANSDTLPDACRTDCTLPTCGDGVTDSGEECDDGASNSDTVPDACRTDCTLAACGDGIADPGEECDDGNTGDDDGCSSTCRNEACGDGMVNNGCEPKEPAKLIAADDSFGQSVSVDGNTVVVGVPFDDDAGFGSGSAYVFKRDEGGVDAWGQVAKLTASDATAGDQFGTSVSVSGKTIVVGALSDDAGPDSGSAYVFERSNLGGGGAGGWEQVAKLTASDAATEDEFGSSVSVSGNTVVVGAHLDGDAGAASGSAYVFKRSADAWGQVAKLEASDAAANDAFGASVSVSGDTVVVGAPREESYTGAAYVFERNVGGADAWGQVVRLTASDAATEDEFGRSVSVSDNTVVVGAPVAGGVGSGSGSAYVFERNVGGADAWGEVTRLRTGCTVSVRGDVMVLADDYSAQVFQRNKGGANAWGHAGWLNTYDKEGAPLKNAIGPRWPDEPRIPPGVSQASGGGGIPIAVSGDTAIVGQWLDDDAGSDAGAAYIFALGCEGCDDGNANSDTLPDACRTDCMPPGCGDGVIDTGEGCDDGAANSDTLPGACRTDCTLASCGNGVIDGGEACDDGASNSDTAPDACRTNCASAACGDGISDTGEECDDGNTDAGDGCNASCQDECGDGIVDTSGTEQCDDGNNSDGDGCNATCQNEFCGDGVVNNGVPGGGVEQCDDGNNQAGDGCNATCQHEFCSDGIVNDACEGNQIAKLVATDAALGDSFGAIVSVSGNTAVVGSPRDDHVGSNTGSAYVFELRELSGGGADAWDQDAKLIASDAAHGARFGESVSISGDTVVVGAPGRLRGSAYVFERRELSGGGADVWGQIAKLTASDGDANDRFGSSVSVSGDTIVVGAESDEDGGFNSGSVYVFERGETGGGGAGVWVQVAKLTAPDAAGWDRFGAAVFVSGDTVVVGAGGVDDVGFDSGSAYVFERSEISGGGGAAWRQVAQLSAPDADSRDYFGDSVSVDGDTVVVGARGDDDAGSESGSVYVFQRNVGGADGWGHVAKLAASDASRFDAFGGSATVSGDVIVVGSPGDDDAESESGSAYVFRRRNLSGGDAGDWVQVAKLTASDATARDFFGVSASVDGDTVVVGAHQTIHGGGRPGTAYILTLECEECDDGNNVDNDGCAADCSSVCIDVDGDGFGQLADPVACPGAEGDCDDSESDVHPGQPEDCDNGIDDDCDGLIDAGDRADCVPLVLDALWATANADGTVTVGWRTVQEVDMLGFGVLRIGDSREDGELEELTLQPIPPRGRTPGGAEYTYTDTHPILGRSHYYVVGMDRQGQVQRFGPVSVEVPSSR